MAPINFEEHIKNKLEKREMKPREEAWEILQAQLDANDSKKSNKRYWWLGLAASFAGFLLIASFMFKDEKNDIPAVVETEAVQKNNPNETNAISNKIIDKPIESIVASEQVTSKEKKITHKQDFKVSKSEKKPQAIKSIQLNTVAVNDKIIEKESFDEVPILDSDVSFEEQKAKAIVAEIRALQAGNKSVSATEIDALLKAAHKEIAFNNLNDTSKTIDADALLKSVEEDLEESFRDRVFKLLQSGYEGVKTAVAERNN